MRPDRPVGISGGIDWAPAGRRVGVVLVQWTLPGYRLQAIPRVWRRGVCRWGTGAR